VHFLFVSLFRAHWQRQSPYRITAADLL